jgi:prepilin-type N-terminal cleavage/methylation domain-containing protein
MRRRRRGFTLVELLVVISVIAVLTGMLLPAVQKVREAAYKVQSQNNLKQIAIACHNCNETHGGLPPQLGWFPHVGPNAGWGTLFFHLLPFVEQDNLRSSALNPATRVYEAPHAGANGMRLSVYLNPGDPTTSDESPVGGMAVSSYAANLQAFGLTGT